MVVSVRGNQHELPERFHFASAITKAGSQAITAPMYGTMFRSPEAIP